jgi:hypothetical protein
MRKLLTQMLAGARSWLGWNDISETRVSPEHGWLLPRASTEALAHAQTGAPTAQGRRAGRS